FRRLRGDLAQFGADRVKSAPVRTLRSRGTECRPGLAEVGPEPDSFAPLPFRLLPFALSLQRQSHLVMAHRVVGIELHCLTQREHRLVKLGVLNLHLPFEYQGLGILW